MGIRIGVDIGGTFTDFIVATEEGVEVSKVLSTPDAPDAALVEGLELIAGARDLTVDQLLADVELFMHGTTIATNTVIQRNGPRVGLLQTEGFRDVLELRDGRKKDRYNLHVAPPEPFVPRYLRLGVQERVVYTGEVETPLSEDSVRRALRTFEAEGVEAVAVSLLWSMVNPAHEQAIRALIAEELPDAYVALSSEILPALREYPRTCATALSAYVGPVLGQYLRRLAAYLRDHGYRYDLLIMQATGGAASVASIEERPVLAIGSGPAAGPAAGARIGADVGADNVMVIDMGGTSFEVSLITEGRFSMTQAAEVAGMPIGVAAVDIESIGAGGGSIAWLDSGGMLRVGPQSAGAAPGPACYGLGGELPTVTDANLVLGFLDPSNVLGGRITLDRERAERAIATIGEPLGLEVPEAAAAIYDIVNTNMEGAMRSVSVMRGVDPRRYVIVNGGGAGGLHVAKIAQDLGVGQVICPAVAGGLCAFGMLAADVRQSALTTFPTNTDALDLDRVNAIYARMESDAREAMLRQGFADETISFERRVDAKYPYQTHHLMVELPGGVYDESNVAALAERFHEQHERLYSYALRDMSVDMSGWRVTAIGQLPALPIVDAPMGPVDSADAVVDTREIYFAEHGGYRPMPVYDGGALRAGMVIEDGGIVELPTTTVTLFPQHVLTVRANGDFHIDTGIEALDGAVLARTRAPTAS